MEKDKKYCSERLPWHIIRSLDYSNIPGDFIFHEFYESINNCTNMQNIKIEMKEWLNENQFDKIEANKIEVNKILIDKILTDKIRIEQNAYIHFYTKMKENSVKMLSLNNKIYYYTIYKVEKMLIKIFNKKDFYNGNIKWR